jgi:hypothetical protein
MKGWNVCTPKPTSHRKIRTKNVLVVIFRKYGKEFLIYKTLIAYLVAVDGTDCRNSIIFSNVCEYGICEIYTFEFSFLNGNWR